MTLYCKLKSWIQTYIPEKFLLHFQHESLQIWQHKLILPSLWTLRCVGVCVFVPSVAVSPQRPSLTRSAPSPSERLERSIPGPGRRWRPGHRAVPHAALRLRHCLRRQCARLPDERGEFSDKPRLCWGRIKHLANHSYMCRFFTALISWLVGVWTQTWEKRTEFQSGTTQPAG